jgi:hypothetical protein
VVLCERCLKNCSILDRISKKLRIRSLGLRGHRAARRDFGARVRAALRSNRAAQQHDSGCGPAPRRAITRAAPRDNRAARFLHIFMYICIFTLYSSIFQHISAHSSTFRICAIFVVHVGICRNLLNMKECWNISKYGGTYQNMPNILEMVNICGNIMKHAGICKYVMI